MRATARPVEYSKANSRIDEQRRNPHQQDQRDRDPVELQAKRKGDRE